MSGHNPAAQPEALLVGIGMQHRKSRAAAPRLVDQCRHLAGRQRFGHDAEIIPRAIQRKGGIAAVDEEILQLDGSPRLHADGKQRLVERPASGKQFAAHEDLADNRIYKG